MNVAVGRVVERLLGEPVGPLRVADMGRSASTTYFAEAGAMPIVVKTSATAGVLDHTRHNLAELSALGLPVPRVYGFVPWTADDGFELVVMERFRGRDLYHELPAMTPPQMRALAAQIVDIQRRVATLPRNTGCGYVAIGDVATRTWADVVRRPNGYPLADPLPVDTIDLVPRLGRAIDASAPYLASVEPVCFLDDLTTKNVIVDRGVLTGVVDFDVVCYGDPAFHLGLTAAAVTANAPAACRSYVDALARESRLDEPQQHAVDLYEACFLVNFLANENPHKAGPWRTIAATAAAARLDAAEAYFAGG